MQQSARNLPTLTPEQMLLRKLDGWLIQQPEWVLVFARSRSARRELARQVAKHLTTIPTRKFEGVADANPR